MDPTTGEQKLVRVSAHAVKRVDYLSKYLARVQSRYMDHPIYKTLIIFPSLIQWKLQPKSLSLICLRPHVLARMQVSISLVCSTKDQPLLV